MRDSAHVRSHDRTPRHPTTRHNSGPLQRIRFRQTSNPLVRNAAHQVSRFMLGRVRTVDYSLLVFYQDALRTRTFTLVEATYEALTVWMTAFIKFLAAVISEVALSSCRVNRIYHLSNAHRIPAGETAGSHFPKLVQIKDRQNQRSTQCVTSRKLVWLC